MSHVAYFAVSSKNCAKNQDILSANLHLKDTHSWSFDSSFPRRCFGMAKQKTCLRICLKLKTTLLHFYNYLDHKSKDMLKKFIICSGTSFCKFKFCWCVRHYILTPSETIYALSTWICYDSLYQTLHVCSPINFYFYHPICKRFSQSNTSCKL